MPIGLGVITNSYELTISNFSVKFQNTLQSFFPPAALGCHNSIIQSNSLINNTLFINRDVKLTFPNFGTEFRVLHDDFESYYEYEGRSFVSKSFSIDISGFRRPEGYLMLAAIAVLIALEADGMIEDPANIWVASEISRPTDFIDRIKIETELDSKDLDRLSGAFIAKMNRGDGIASLPSQ